jgi:two-component system cell cycle sensor histidine kinase/response regulator CckA
MFGKARYGDMMARQEPGKSAYIVFGISLLISVVLFIYDWYRPIDISVWLFYLIPLLFTSYAAPRRFAYLLLLICTLLVGLGYFVSASRGFPLVAILNRIIGATVLWLTIVILLERKRVEDDLRESTERYRDLVELSPEMIYIQQGGKVVFINSAGVKLIGATNREDLVGKRVSHIFHRNFREKESDRIQMEREEIKESPIIEQYLRFDGTTVDVEVSAVSIEYLGKPALQVFARDITARKNLEEQLRQSQKIEAVGRLAGGIAHDFNNLMTVITGYVGLTKKRVAKPDLVSRGLEEIGKAASRATQLTQQLIAFGRKQILQPQILDLNHIISNTDKMLHHLIGEHIELVTILDHEIGRVKADPGQIELVIVNLTLNARDAMPKGGRIIIETKNTILSGSITRREGDLPPGPYVELVFRDNGIGMDEETKSHIFEPYFTTKEVGKGAGLGLASVHGIIRQSGGDILVDSEPEKGTTFTIFLPRTAEEPQREAIDLVLDSPPGLETILVVEDEEPVRNMVKETLEDAGYRVFDAADGEEALELMSRSRDPIHLVLTDVIMPKKDGRSLATRVASLYPETKILFMTGYVEHEIDEIHHPFGRKPSIFKPFTPNELASKVREVMDS